MDVTDSEFYILPKQFVPKIGTNFLILTFKMKLLSVLHSQKTVYFEDFICRRRDVIVRPNLLLANRNSPLVIKLRCIRSRYT